MDVLHLYGITPTFLDVLFSLHTICGVVVAGVLAVLCHDMIADRKQVFLVILMVGVVWFIPAYKLIKFTIKDGIETRRGRRLAKLRARRDT